ncbi:hypothetical protein, partial [Corynebacterium accolens]|uniref:hypothetical protein n=1 Tax=Corynebacterium accolens TaxID=38284 RepID=UPI001EDB4FDC
SKIGREKPKPNQKNKPPQTHKRAHAGVQKLLQRKNHCLPQPDGAQKGRQKVEHNHMPTNPSMQPKH